MCEMNNQPPPPQSILEAPKKKTKNEEKFFKVCLLISRVCFGDFLQYEMWAPSSGGYLHFKLGAIWIRHHGATYVCVKIVIFFLFLSIYLIQVNLSLSAPIFPDFLFLNFSH